MEKITLGNSIVEVSPIAFGAWAIGGWMWGGADKNDAVQAINKAIEYGITTIDTAPVYGFGQSEEIIGEVIKGKREKLQILSKFGLNWKTNDGVFYFSTKDNHGNDIDIYRYASKKSVIKECDDSLRRLNTDYIDLLQIHWPDSSTPVEETMEALSILIDKGKILAAGVCNYDVELLDEARKFINIASNQMPYSMLRRDIENELVPYCIENNTGILAYSPLQRGILTGKFNANHSFPEGDTRSAQPWYKKENLIKVNRFLDGLKALAREKEATIAQIVLRWTLQQSGISCILAGARNPEQVVENAGALRFNLSKEELMNINTNLNQLKVSLD